MQCDVCYNKSLHKELNIEKHLLCLNEREFRETDGRFQKSDILVK